MSGFYVTPRQRRNAKRRWERKVLPMRVRALSEIAKQQADNAAWLRWIVAIQWTVIAAMGFGLAMGGWR